MVDMTRYMQTKTLTVYFREFEKEGVIGKLHNKFYTTVGNGTAVASAKAFAEEYAQKLIADGVDAVIMTST